MDSAARLGCAPLHGDALILEAASSGAASSRAHASMEGVTYIQLSIRAAFIEQPLLTSATGRLRCTATDGLVTAGQQRLLQTQLLHTTLQHARIAVLCGMGSLEADLYYSMCAGKG